MDDFQFEVLQKGIDGINARLDRQNGRLGSAEQEIAVLQDRSDRAEKQGGIFGAIGGGVVTGVILTIKALMGSK
jgi:hypothetical protein